jgi:hypothetical protein
VSEPAGKTKREIAVRETPIHTASLPRGVTGSVHEAAALSDEVRKLRAELQELRTARKHP